MMSRRQAVRVLRTEAEPPLTKRLAEGLLVAGLAGPGEDLGFACAYDDERVRALAGARHVDADQLPAICGDGLFVVRVSGVPGLLDQPVEDRFARYVGPWWVSPPVRIRLRLQLERHGFAPLAATVASYVIDTADVVALDLVGARSAERTRLVLTAPGAWSRSFEGRRFQTPPGNPWLFWRPTRRMGN